jgi:hypothetical protein
MASREEILLNALRYISSPTMGLPPGREAEEFVRSGDVDDERGLYSLEVCIRTAKMALEKYEKAGEDSGN